MTEKVRVPKTEDYKTIHVAACNVFWRNNPDCKQLEAIILSAEIEVVDYGNTASWEPRLECRLIFTPESAKRFSEYLNQRIKNFEEEHGTIKLPEIPKPKETDREESHFPIYG